MVMRAESKRKHPVSLLSFFYLIFFQFQVVNQCLIEDKVYVMLVMDTDSFSDAKWQTLLANTFSRQNNQVKHNFRRWCHQTSPKLQSWLFLKPETLSTWRAAYAPPHSLGKTPQELQDTKL